MSATSIRVPKILGSQKRIKRADTLERPFTKRLQRAAWFTLAFLLSVAAGPFTAIGVIGAIFSLSHIETEEPLPNKA
ncbi:hypothetical protein DBT_0350 [Dissulfuribacter thermophilus]|uniref:Uncharacterized protein n=1 Tax=Dissulfuribacter thermophilus TaxID=1156395 RepID=A0A1B9F9H5_9BACT|nr:hypothetical protein [Dissulfuribacter thermophilus]OCC16533.1 hypothetical protein DBT_0350 [Dissulfuribacter thermophilus]